MSTYAPQPQQPYGQQPQTPYPPHPAPPVKAKRHWKAPTFIGIGALVLGILIGNAGEGGASSPTPTVTVTADGQAPPVTESPEYQALVAERDALAQQVTDLTAAAEAAQAPAGLTNGMFIVGQTIEPGRYSMVGEDDLAYVDQKNGDDYLLQEVAGKGETIVIDVADVVGSLVTFSGVTQITKIG